MRVIGFVDGFNLYHSIADRKRNDLKWLDLWKLCLTFAPVPQFDLVAVYYFSAFAEWRKDAVTRHREYVRTLEAVGVTPVLGAFKAKPRRCRVCGATWTRHEEKATDVNMAIYLLDLAHRDKYDRALVVTADSDLAPAVRIVRATYPAKSVRIVTPHRRRDCHELTAAVGGAANVKYVKTAHVEQSRLSRQVQDASGAVVATRPPAYAP